MAVRSRLVEPSPPREVGVSSSYIIHDLGSIREALGIGIGIGIRIAGSADRHPTWVLALATWALMD